MIIARRVGALLLAVAALAVWFLMAPRELSAHAQKALQDRSGDIESALSEYESNNAMAESAPQQQVVNGWAEKELLTVIAQEQNDANTRVIPPPPVRPNDNRIPALIGLGVLGVALALVTTPRQRPRAASAAGQGPTPQYPSWNPAGSGMPSSPIAAPPGQ